VRVAYYLGFVGVFPCCTFRMKTSMNPDSHHPRTVSNVIRKSLAGGWQILYQRYIITPRINNKYMIYCLRSDCRVDQDEVVLLGKSLRKASSLPTYNLRLIKVIIILWKDANFQEVAQIGH